MNLDLLQHHAKRHGHWDIKLTKRETLECHFNVGTNSDNQSWDDFSYYLNGVRINQKRANDLLDSMFEKRMA